VCLSGFEPARLRGFTSEVSLTYGIFHYFLKKGKKQLMIVIIFRPLQLLAGRDLNPQLSRF